ncbi:MAG TPA: hypothetical protein VM077_05565 [Candidatus Limnocylindrales bacterium]|nr:hypothetical protein [Candidatus Limnocylindrales bacterium]
MLKTKIKILPSDRISLTQDQKNLIELAFVKQIPPEDAKFLERVQKEAGGKIQPEGQSFAKLSNYFIKKYDIEFGMLLLAAVMGGKDQYNITKKSIEELNAKKRIDNQN